MREAGGLFSYVADAGGMISVAVGSWQMVVIWYSPRSRQAAQRLPDGEAESRLRIGRAEGSRLN